ncbi:MAG: response regulator [Gammaproteobacteria bacterium]
MPISFKSKSLVPSRNYLLFALLMLLSATLLLVWVGQTRIDDFHAYHLSTARDAAASVAVEVSQFVAEKKRLVDLFGREKLDLIQRFVKEPQNEQLYSELQNNIASYFPNYFAFTVADANGTPYFADFDGFVGESCKNDIESFARNNNYNPRIHPNPEAYHFDIMASFGEGEHSGVLFISFHADVLTSLISSSQALGHELMLTYPQKQSLIEVTSEGARNHWIRDDYRMSQQELDRVLYQKPVPGTVWFATDLQKPDLFELFRGNIITQSLIIFSVFATIGLFTLIVIKKEENRREKIEQDLVIAKERADIANKAKSEFLANMSHELRTPLNAIIGYSEMLAEEAVDGGFSQLMPDIGQIKSAGHHLLSLINEILDLSKIEAGQMEVFLEEFNLRALADEVIATVQPLVEKNYNQLTLQCEDDIGEIRSDTTKLRQILFNLISNASKFTQHGNISVHMYRETVDEYDYIRVNVKDTGIGMTESQLNRIFQPFAQADSSTTRKYGGTGLGLAITKRFCEMLGGEITASSAPGKGSTFFVTVKNLVAGEEPTPAPATQIGADPAKQRSKNKSNTAEKRNTVSTILVIDDDPNIRNLASRYLHKEGFNVETAPNGKEGLELAKKIKPQVITLDVMMPVMDGWATLKQIKSDPELKDTPVAMLTQLDERGLGFVLGADDYLFKPIDWKALSTSIKKWVRKKRHANILVITKTTSLRQQINTVLQKQGYCVIAVESCELAMQAVQEHNLSLVILDLKVGKPSDGEFMEMLHDNERFNTIPVVALTNTELSEQEQNWLAKAPHRILLDDSTAQEQFLTKIRALLRTIDSRNWAA